MAARVDTSTDDLETTLTSYPKTVAFWVYRTSNSSFDYMFGKGGTSGFFDFGRRHWASTWTVNRGFSTTDGRWDVSEPTRSAWHHVVVVYDHVDALSDPVVYIDGASVTVTEDITPVGTIETNSANMTLFNISASSTQSASDMRGADFGMWSVMLNASEAKALSSGVHPHRIRYADLLRCHPCWENAIGRDISSNHSDATNHGLVAERHAPVTLYTPKWATTMPVIGAGAPPAARRVFVVS